uniref:Uncharacterized protein n=1 Tax=Panagrolaimus sp. ES5 TaxID=591445 RepID=A0AC34FGN2_9BILA
MFSRQLLTIFLAAIAVTLIAASCVDRKDNLVDIGDETEGAYNAHFQNAVGATYDDSDTPSCYKSEPNLKLPGVIKLVSGT